MIEDQHVAQPPYRVNYDSRLWLPGRNMWLGLIALLIPASHGALSLVGLPQSPISRQKCLGKYTNGLLCPNKAALNHFDAVCHAKSLILQSIYTKKLIVNLGSFS